MKLCRNPFVVFLVGGVIAAVAPLPAQGTDDFIIEARKKQMPEQVFQSVLPELQKLAPGDDLSSISELRNVYSIMSKSGEQEGFFVAAPGWINSMSGDAFGGFFMFGALFAKSGQLINGRHVFGYVWGDLNLVPQFEIITQATVIDKIEYDRLRAQETNEIGLVPTESGRVYFKDVRVLKTRALPFRGISDVEGQATTIEPFKKNELPPFYTEQAFQGAEEILLQLNKGIDLWDMLEELGALFMTTDYGENHSFLVNGFLNYKNVRPQHLETDEALYVLRPFGHIQKKRFSKDKEIIKLIVIFKNGLLEKITPYSGGDLRSYLPDSDPFSEPGL